MDCTTSTFGCKNLCIVDDEDDICKKELYKNHGSCFIECFRNTFDVDLGEPHKKS